MPKAVCVYCSSSNRIHADYFEVATQVGRLLAERGHTLLYGGGNVGLMGAVARAVHKGDGRVVGVIPDGLRQIEGVAYEVADELVVTETMQERKALLFTRADAFLVLPGGIGTLEELMEVLTLRSLGYHNKRIALLNTAGFYDLLLQLFEHFYAGGFARERVRTLYHVASTPEAALDYLDAVRV